MKRFFVCPHCETVLNPSDKIILRGEVGPQRGLFLFSPRPGNYDVRIPPGFKLKRGDRVDFHCPVCTHDLVSPKDPEWALLKVHSPGGNHGEIVFSREFGKKATYFITQEEVRSYGPDAQEDGYR